MVNVIYDILFQWIGLFYKMVLDPSVNKEETIKGMHVELDRLEKAIGTKKYFGGRIVYCMFH